MSFSPGNTMCFADQGAVLAKPSLAGVALSILDCTDRYQLT